MQELKDKFELDFDIIESLWRFIVIRIQAMKPRNVTTVVVTWNMR